MLLARPSLDLRAPACASPERTCSASLPDMPRRREHSTFEPGTAALTSTHPKRASFPRAATTLWRGVTTKTSLQSGHAGISASPHHDPTHSVDAGAKNRRGSGVGEGTPETPGLPARNTHRSPGRDAAGRAHHGDELFAEAVDLLIGQGSRVRRSPIGLQSDPLVDQRPATRGLARRRRHSRDRSRRVVPAPARRLPARQPRLPRSFLPPGPVDVDCPH